MQKLAKINNKNIFNNEKYFISESESNSSKSKKNKNKLNESKP